MFTGEVVAIYIASDEGKPTESVFEVRAHQGRGLEGDRYASQEGKFSQKDDPGREVTLIESEAISALRKDYDIDLGLGGSRRNIVTRGVPLNHLVGQEFRVGETTLRGIKLCEPCGYLEGLTEKGIRKGLAHRGGLNAQIISEGVIRAGDEVSGGPS
ncbi:MAG: MOSC domain-containing protein [Actinomycetota bacterium]|nr:MOSC domain-containing protein [Actinomycetota bacterium]